MDFGAEASGMGLESCMKVSHDADAGIVHSFPSISWQQMEMKHTVHFATDH